jgi:hypothetical protein
MRRIHSAVLIITLLVSSTAFGVEQKIAESKAALIREFLKVTDAKEGTADAFIDILGGRLGLPMAPETTRGEVREGEEMAEMAEETQLEIYDRYFTEKQLRDLVTFFKTPTGQHYVEVARKIAAETRKNLQASTDHYLAETNERNRANRTRNDFRGLGVALKSYFAEHNRYPRAHSVDELAEMLSPKYIQTVPKQDAWGRSIQYYSSDDGQHYRIVSAGPDGKFAAESELAQSDDIVYYDGRFLHGGDPNYPQ